jgi:hypothetical protein
MGYVPFKMKYKNLEEVVGQLRSAVVAHGKQADTIEGHIDDMQEKSPMTKKGPCWSGYEMIGMKEKDGRQVPNCVPKK